MREDSEIIVATFSVMHESRNDQIAEIMPYSILIYVYIYISINNLNGYTLRCIILMVDKNIRNNDVHVKYYNRINIV